MRANLVFRRILVFDNPIDCVLRLPMIFLIACPVASILVFGVSVVITISHKFLTMAN